MADIKSETKNYNSCPLKKRPVLFIAPIVPVPEPEQEEPVNLCVRKVIKDESQYVNKMRSTPLKDITSNHQERVYRPYKIEEDSYTSRIACVKQESLYNLLPGYAANTTNTLNYTQHTSPSSPSSSVTQHIVSTSPIHPEPYWPSYSREPSMSPPTHSHMYAPIKSMPSPPPPQTVVQQHITARVPPPHYQHEDYYPSENVLKSESHYVNKNRYVPYHVSRQHHIVDQYHNSMSPTHSHSSLNSLGSPRSSMSPASTSSSIPEDHYHLMQNASTTITKPVSYESGKEHSAAMKNELPRYQCSDCAKSYSTYSGLTKHKQFHCTASATSQVKKTFECQYCPKTYTSVGALKMHIRTHTKPCKCHLCGKAFSRPWLLQGHIRTHTGDKPFSCQYCHRAFADKSNLRAHRQTHSDIKKYACTTCSKTFSRMSLLTKHMEGGCPGMHEHHQILN